MVIAWIPVDDFGGDISMYVYKGTHTEYSKRHEFWNPYDYCSVEKNTKYKCNNQEFEKLDQIINVTKENDVSRIQIY